MTKTILITTDFHADQKALAGLDRLLSDNAYDSVIMAGDLINARVRELTYVEQFIDLIQTKYRLPLFGLHGNNEPKEAWLSYREKDINIHLQTREWAGYHICGVGSFGYLDEQGFEDLSVENLAINQQTIFVTHVPPRQIKPAAQGPLVHIFGHRHHLAYTKQVGATLQVQCPAGNLGRVTELDLPSKAVRFISLPT
jgi:Icc-related predicted phosphoesterase